MKGPDMAVSMKVFEENGDLIKPGDTIVNFRGEEWRFRCASRMPVMGKSGKILAKDKDGYYQEFCPSVFNLVIEMWDDEIGRIV
jgi:hypothetical protein